MELCRFIGNLEIIDIEVLIKMIRLQDEFIEEFLMLFLSEGFIY